MNYIETLCACGCGELIRQRPESKRPFRFKPGHKRRRIEKGELVACACGCGELMSPYDERGRARTFLPSHWSKTQPPQRITVQCETCGKSFEKIPSHYARVDHHFCSQQCEGLHAQQTGKRRGEANGHYNSITVPCAGCGEPVTKPYSLVMRRQNRVYCAACIPAYARKGRKGFYVGYPPEFNTALRRKIRARDEYTCQECGRHQSEVGTLQVHHIDYDKFNNNPRNLIALCAVCHGRTNWAMDTWKAKFQALMDSRVPQ